MNLDNRIQWKDSIGPLAQRRGTANLWGYWTSNGLGFHEYLRLDEDLGADALWNARTRNLIANRSRSPSQPPRMDPNAHG
jgi:alpha-L-arabinofuranosidase